MAAQSKSGNYSTVRLFRSISHNEDIIAIRALLQHFDIDVRGSEGNNTPLLCAGAKGRKDVFKLLIKLGANVNVFDNQKCTVLHYASKRGWTKIVRSLVKKVPDLNACDIMGNTSMHCASSLGLLKIVRCLMEEGADINQKNLMGDTPLLCAAKSKKYKVFNNFLRSKANVGCNNSLLLYYALRNKWHKTVLSLLKRAPFLNKALIDETTFNVTSSKGHLEILKFLVGERAINRMFGQAALYSAACDGQLEVVKWLVEKGPVMKEPDFREIDCWSETALYGASKYGHLKIVKYLLKKRVDINARACWGKTALHAASLHGHLQIVKCLLERGIDIEARDCWGETALLNAPMVGCLELVQCLVEKGADINVKGINVDSACSSQCTILHYASERRWIDMVKSLIERGCDLDAKDSYGATALHFACLDIAQILLQAGASWDIADNYGCSPFYYVTMKKEPDFELLKLFIENGAYFKPAEYAAIVKSSSLEVLQDVKLCCQAVVNKFNNHDLLELYKLLVSEKLPRIAKMKIKSNTEVAQAIERAVRFDIQTYGYCHILEVRPMALCVFSVGSVLELCQNY